MAQETKTRPPQRERIMTIGGIEFDWQLTLIIVIGTILPMLDYYGHKFANPITSRFGYELVGIAGKAYDRLFLYFLIPLFIILVIFRDPVSDFGFQIGNWRVGLFWTAVGCAGMAVILWFVARDPSMKQYYEVRAPKNVWRLIYLTGIDLFGWEFIWRGLLLFGMARVLGPGPAIFLQAVPFAFMHLGKPEVETLSTIFGGAAFGFVAWQSESFIYPFFIHWFIASFTQLIALGKIG